MGDCLSSIEPVLLVVPQWSILGLLLFIIFVNGMFSVVQHCTLSLLADDVKLFRRTTTYEDSMLVQQDLTSLFTWSGDNHPAFNCMKSVVVSFRKSCSVFRCNFQYNISGNNLNTIPLQKDLSAYISHDLSWSDHPYKIVSCAMKQLYLIRHSFNTNSTRAKKILYISLVRSQLQYCSQLWRPKLVKDLLFIE